MANPTLASLLPADVRPLGHLETSNDGVKRPVDNSRWDGYNQSKAADVVQHCEDLWRMGIHDLSPNIYAPGSTDAANLALYLGPWKAAGGFMLPDIDKNVYKNTKNPLQSLTDYINGYVIPKVWGLSNPAISRIDGRKVATIFTDPADDPLMFRALEKAFKDISFVYDSAAKADPFNSQTMGWVRQGLDVSFEAWSQRFSGSPNLQLPCIFAGFNDAFKGQSCWGGPARIWPAGGPSLDVLMRMSALVKQYWAKAQWVQLVTIDDLNEGTNLMPHRDGTGGFLSYPPPKAVPVAPKVTSGEIWLEPGIKLRDLDAGDTLTVVRHYSDGNMTKTAVKV